MKMNSSELLTHPTSYTNKHGLLNNTGNNSRFDFVILSKLDKDGNLNLLHTKPLSVEILNQVPDSLVLFSEGLNNRIYFTKFTIAIEINVNLSFFFNQTKRIHCTSILLPKMSNMPDLVSTKSL